MPDQLNFTDALALCKKGLEQWKAKLHNAKWWKRIDGTPIPNDLLVNIAEVLAQRAAAPAGEREPSGDPGAQAKLGTVNSVGAGASRGSLRDERFESAPCRDSDQSVQPDNRNDTVDYWRTRATTAELKIREFAEQLESLPRAGAGEPLEVWCPKCHHNMKIDCRDYLRSASPAAPPLNAIDALMEFASHTQTCDELPPEQCECGLREAKKQVLNWLNQQRAGVSPVAEGPGPK